MQIKKQQFEPDMEQQTGSKLGKAVYCNPSYLTYMSHQGSPNMQIAAAAAAKSLQSCPTLCDPLDGSPPGFPIPGILQARTLDWGAIAFSKYTDYIMWNAGLDEAQAGIKIARWNINNLRYADDTTLMAENKEKLKSLLMKVKEESEKVGLKFKI